MIWTINLILLPNLISPQRHCLGSLHPQYRCNYNPSLSKWHCLSMQWHLNGTFPKAGSDRLKSCSYITILFTVVLTPIISRMVKYSPSTNTKFLRMILHGIKNNQPEKRDALICMTSTLDLCQYLRGLLVRRYPMKFKYVSFHELMNMVDAHIHMICSNRGLFLWEYQYGFRCININVGWWQRKLFSRAIRGASQNTTSSCKNFFRTAW